MNQSKPLFNVVVYLGPADPQVDLEPMKLYRVATHEPNDPADHLRIIDESGEDYLYPAHLFAPLDVPQRVASAMQTS